MTLIAIHHLETDGHTFAHGTEIMPGLLATKTVAKLLDQGYIKELPRRSLYRLLHHFSGCSETELVDKELQQYTVQD
jgi:hypothetical protein